MGITSGKITLSDTNVHTLDEFYENLPGHMNEYIYFYAPAGQPTVIVGDSDIEFTGTAPEGMPIIQDCWHPMDLPTDESEVNLRAQTANSELSYLVVTREVA